MMNRMFERFGASAAGKEEAIKNTGKKNQEGCMAKA
jgi:hypothetical protein